MNWPTSFDSSQQMIPDSCCDGGHLTGIKDLIPSVSSVLEELLLLGSVVLTTLPQGEGI